MLIHSLEQKRVGTRGLKNLLITQALSLFSKEYLWPHGYAEATYENYAMATGSFVRLIGDLPIATITLEDIYKWRLQAERIGMGRNCVNSYMYRLRNLLRHFRKVLIFDPEDIIIPKRQDSLPKYLTVPEIQQLLDGADLRAKVIISLLYSSGMRVGELTQVRVKDINGGTVKIRGKGGKERIVFVDDTAQNYIRQYLASRTDTRAFLLYSQKATGLGVARIQKIIKELARLIPDKVITPHVLRHSFATHMIQAGCGVFHLQKMLGHAHISTTQIYVHLGTPDIASAYKKFHNTLQ